MYDLSRQKVSKNFTLKARVSALTVNYCDAYIAAGCEDGSLQLVTVQSNIVSSPMMTQKCVGHKISCLRYSVVKVKHQVILLLLQGVPEKGSNAPSKYYYIQSFFLGHPVLINFLSL